MRIRWMLVLIVLAGCDSVPDAVLPVEPGEAVRSACVLPEQDVYTGAVRDAIVSLDDPTLTFAESVSYLSARDRVIGLRVGETALAIPYDILWWHEIVNVTVAGRPLAVTYCPLTGSGLVFDRSPLGGATLGVSGLLYQNNLIVYDRSRPDALWAQIGLAALCETSGSASPVMWPAVETTWEGWKALYPNTHVLDPQSLTGRYVPNPYRNYDRSPSLLFPMAGQVDERRPRKEQVLGVVLPTGAFAFPFEELDDGQPVRVVIEQIRGNRIAVFWDRTRQTAQAFHLDSEDPQAFQVWNGRIFDEDMGREWDLQGSVVSPTGSERRLCPVQTSHVAYWFAWAAFHPDTRIFGR